MLLRVFFEVMFHIFLDSPLLALFACYPYKYACYVRVDLVFFTFIIEGL